ncbi:hypothetical protein D3C80_1352040 [compost metagenome]
MVLPFLVVFSTDARMEARCVGVYLLIVRVAASVAMGAVFAAALFVLAAGAATAFAGFGSAFLRGARVFFVAPTGSAAFTSTGVSFTAAMVSSAIVDFSR